MEKLNRLFRSRRTRIIGGVAGGLAEYFAVDVVLIRLLWVVAAFVGGGGVLAYIIAWIVIPEENSFVSEKYRDDATLFHGEGEEGFTSAEESWHSLKRRRNAGLLLIGLGIIFLIHQIFGPLFHFLWPLLIVAAGIFLLTRNGKGAGE